LRESRRAYANSGRSRYGSECPERHDSISSLPGC
jgi:hypothetical protein